MSQRVRPDDLIALQFRYIKEEGKDIERGRRAQVWNPLSGEKVCKK